MASQKVLQPHLLCGKGDVAPNVLLPGDPGRVTRLAQLLDGAKEIAYNREFHTITGRYKGMPVSICSTGIGGPSTAIAMEELIKLGAKRFVRVGSCGGNTKDIKLGDLIISDSVVREDHTCLDYVPLQFPAIADPELLQAMISAAKGLKVRFHVGPSLSEDALYSETNKANKSYWRKFGVLAQDMEAATVLTLARIRGVKAASVLLVVDTLKDKDFTAKIGVYSQQAKKNKGGLMADEQLGAEVALEALKLMNK
jgi:uridine phosphorylase